MKNKSQTSEKTNFLYKQKDGIYFYMQKFFSATDSLEYLFVEVIKGISLLLFSQYLFMSTLINIAIIIKFDGR